MKPRVFLSILILYLVFVSLSDTVLKIVAYNNFEKYITQPITIHIDSVSKISEGDINLVAYYKEIYHPDIQGTIIHAVVEPTSRPNQFLVKSDKIITLLEIFIDSRKKINSIYLGTGESFRKNINSFSLGPFSQRSFIPKLAGAMNYRGDMFIPQALQEVVYKEFFKTFFTREKILYCAIVFVLLFIIAFSTYHLKIFSSETYTPHRIAFKKNIWLWVGCLLGSITILFLLLEYVSPYFFSHNDNFYYFLPNLLHGNSMIFSGAVPFINMYQYLGAPLLEVGIHGFFYPLNLLAYFISSLILHNSYLLFEISAFLHLLIGGIAMFFLLSKQGIRNSVSFFASLSYVSSAYVLVWGANWIFILPTVVCAPIIFLICGYLKHRVSLSIIALLAIMHAIYFLGGNTQLFLYMVAFECIFFVMHSMKGGKRYYCMYAFLLSLVLTSILIAPFIAMQLNTSLSAQRGGAFASSVVRYLSYRGNEPFSAFVYALNPFSSSMVDNTRVIYFGVIFFLGFIASFFSYSVKKLHNWDPYTLCAVFAWICSFGPPGILYALGSILPVLNNMYVPWKFTQFISFFSIISGAMMVERYVANRSGGHRKIALCGIACITLVGILVNTFAVNASHASKESMPSLIKQISQNEMQEFSKQRVYSSTDSNTSCAYISGHEPRFLSMEFPTYFRLIHFYGFEPFSSAETLKRTRIFPQTALASLAEYGVQWLFYQKCKDSSNLLSGIVTPLTPYRSDGELVIYKIPHAKPLVYQEDSLTDLDFTMIANGVLFHTDFSEATHVIVNWLFRKGYGVSIDEETSLAQLEGDLLGRIRVNVPPGKHTVRIVYRYPYFISSVFASVSIFIVLISLIRRYMVKIKKNLTYG